LELLGTLLAATTLQVTVSLQIQSIHDFENCRSMGMLSCISLAGATAHICAGPNEMLLGSPQSEWVVKERLTISLYITKH
jgi:hypothetical protein